MFKERCNISFNVISVFFDINRFVATLDGRASKVSNQGVINCIFVISIRKWSGSYGEVFWVHTFWKLIEKYIFAKYANINITVRPDICIVGI